MICGGSNLRQQSTKQARFLSDDPGVQRKAQPRITWRSKLTKNLLYLHYLHLDKRTSTLPFSQPLKALLSVKFSVGSWQCFRIRLLMSNINNKKDLPSYTCTNIRQTHHCPPIIYHHCSCLRIHHLLLIVLSTFNPTALHQYFTLITIPRPWNGLDYIMYSPYCLNWIIVETFSLSVLIVILPYCHADSHGNNDKYFELILFGDRNAIQYLWRT